MAAGRRPRLSKRPRGQAAPGEDEMDFRDTPDMATFREEVRSFLKQELPNGWGGDGDMMYAMMEGGERIREWMKKLASRGWIAPARPKEYGGAGLSVLEQFVFNEEMARPRA